MLNRPARQGQVTTLGLYLLVGLTIGFLVAWALPELGRHRISVPDWLKDPNTFVRQTDTRFTLISPLLDSEIPTQALSQQLYPYEKKIVSVTHEVIKKHPADRVSFFYKDLSTSSWVGIGENEKYVPASLLKIPVAIAYYKLAENDPALLTQQISVTGEDQNNRRNIKSDQNIEIGKTYTVDELITFMLTESDNNALQALYIYRQDALKNIFIDLKQQFPTTELAIADSEYVSPRSYGRFLSILYNASYLDREDSEKLLSILAQSKYTDGLVAGVPQTVTVAHKFGEREFTKNKELVYSQFHDCGIIYEPGHPYKLCIMSQGQDLAELQEVTREISTAIYNIVHQQ